MKWLHYQLVPQYLWNNFPLSTCATVPMKQLSIINWCHSTYETTFPLSTCATVPMKQLSIINQCHRTYGTFHYQLVPPYLWNNFSTSATVPMSKNFLLWICATVILTLSTMNLCHSTQGTGNLISVCTTVPKKLLSKECCFNFTRCPVGPVWCRRYCPGVDSKPNQSDDLQKRVLPGLLFKTSTLASFGQQAKIKCTLKINIDVLLHNQMEAILVVHAIDNVWLTAFALCKPKTIII